MRCQKASDRNVTIIRSPERSEPGGSGGCPPRKKAHTKEYRVVSRTSTKKSSVPVGKVRPLGARFARPFPCVSLRFAFASPVRLISFSTISPLSHFNQMSYIIANRSELDTGPKRVLDSQITLKLTIKCQPCPLLYSSRSAPIIAALIFFFKFFFIYTENFILESSAWGE